MNSPKVGIASIAVAAAAALSCATGASAVTVTSTGDTGACTLRGAINAAASNNSSTACGPVVSGGTTPINLPANTYTPFDGELVVPAGANIAINGDNVNNPLSTKIDALGASRVFNISSGASVTLSGVTVTGGRTPDSPVGPSIYEIVPVPNGGGIINKGSLTIDHSVIQGNRTGDGGNGHPAQPEGAGGSAGSGGSGGGIYNNDGASLNINASVIKNNLTGSGGTGATGGNGVGGLGHFPNGSAGGTGGYGGSGGGIYNSNTGSVLINNSTISGNGVGRGGDGGMGGMGAGATPTGTGSFFGAGTGGDGGDGGNGGRQYRKDQGTFWDYTLGGGGIYSLGTLTVTNTTISDNGTGAGGNGGPSGVGGQKDSPPNTFANTGRAGTGGGGGRGAGILSGGTTANLTLTNVTFNHNRTGDGGHGGDGSGGSSNSLGGGKGGYGGDGGGLWAQGSHNGQALLTHVTIAANYVGDEGAGGGGFTTAGPGARGRGAGLATGGRYNPSGAGVYLRKTLVYLNGAASPSGDMNCFETAGAGTDIVDQSYNLNFPNDGTCPGSTSTDPELSLLGDFGGPTETMVPAAGSNAIGGVPLAQCNVTTDQRGFPRPGADGTSCDIGAVEIGTGPSAASTTTNLNSSANPSTPGQQVTFTATVSPPPSSGTVEFKDGGTTIPGCATAPLTPGGQFTCSITYPSAGSHSIVAAYSGNSLFQASTSPALNQTVQNTTPPPDTTAPDTMIDSGPSGTISQAEATFTFHGTPGDTAKLQCRLDSGDFADCTSPKAFSGLSGGAHSVAFRAVDAAGNVDASPATRSFTVDAGSPPPKTARIGRPSVRGPDKVDQGRKVTFKVAIPNTGDAAATGVRLRVSGGGVSLEKQVGQVAADKTKNVKVRVKFSQSGRKRLTFRVSSANGGVKSARKTIIVNK